MARVERERGEGGRKRGGGRGGREREGERGERSQRLSNN
jgi:hypothetical protein